jgi:hypothetical protein
MTVENNKKAVEDKKKAQQKKKDDAQKKIDKAHQKEIARQKKIDDELDGQLRMLRRSTKHSEQLRRAAIIYQYEHVFKSPAQSEWDGAEGTINKIKVALCIPRGTKIRSILVEAVKSQMEGLPY